MYKKKYRKAVAMLIVLNTIFKLSCYWLDITSDIALEINLSKSTNAYVPRLYYFMVFFLILQYTLGWIGINLFLKNEFRFKK